MGEERHLPDPSSADPAFQGLVLEALGLLKIRIPDVTIAVHGALIVSALVSAAPIHCCHHIVPALGAALPPLKTAEAETREAAEAIRGEIAGREAEAKALAHSPPDRKRRIGHRFGA